MAIRAALGAGRVRVMRQLLTESILLSLIGGAAGLLISALNLLIARRMHPGNIPRLEELGMDFHVLGFTLLISILTGIIFGLAPALRSWQLDLTANLKAGSNGSLRGGLSIRHDKLRGVLVIAELAIALPLLVGAGLLVRSFVQLAHVPPGFNPQHVISMNVAAYGPEFKDSETRVHFYQELAERTRHLPGVVATGAISALPLTPTVGWGGIHIEGYTPPATEPELQVDFRMSTPSYFSAMQIPLLRGRTFAETDSDKMPRVAIVVKEYGLDLDTRMVVYYPHAQAPRGEMYVVARTKEDPPSLINPIVHQVNALNPHVPMYDIATMERRVQDSMARQRFAMTMLGGFAVFAMILAAIGVYGVMSFLVTQGTADIAIRMALGARRISILSLVFQQGMGLTLVGIVAGLIGALGLTRAMSSLLFGIKRTDPLTFFSVLALLLLVALAACLFPAGRAMRIDPMAALRTE